MKKKRRPLAPSLRLAFGTGDILRPGASKSMQQFPVVRLVTAEDNQGINNLLGRRGVKRLPKASQPALLVSYFYGNLFFKEMLKYHFRDWALDSGAFSAWNLGKEIKLDEYIDKIKELNDGPRPPIEVFALDVIGDWKKTMANTRKMWKAGIEAIPAYHLNDKRPDLIRGLARDYPKIAVGGMVQLKGSTKKRYCEQFFARAWPAKIHGFGVASPELLLSLPWHSTDASSWVLGPCGFGAWHGYGGGSKYLTWRGSDQDLRVEIEFYLDLEHKARVRWKKEMAELEAMDK